MFQTERRRRNGMASLFAVALVAVLFLLTGAAMVQTVQAGPHFADDSSVCPPACATSSARPG